MLGKCSQGRELAMPLRGMATIPSQSGKVKKKSQKIELSKKTNQVIETFMLRPKSSGNSVQLVGRGQLISAINDRK